VFDLGGGKRLTAPGLTVAELVAESSSSAAGMMD
jgi:hypothetical protein